MFVKKLFEDCQNAPITRIDPCLAAPVVHGGDYETFDRQMTEWHRNWTAIHRLQHGDEYELRPVPRASEPLLKITAVWGDFVDDAVKASRLAAMECLDQLASPPWGGPQPSTNKSRS